MRPLPRLHAITDASVLAADDFGVRAAAIAAAGPAVALHARDHSGERRRPRAAPRARLVALARPPEAAVFVNGRPDVAAAVRAQGVQLAQRRPRPGGCAAGVRGGLDRPLGARRRRRPSGRWTKGADFLLVGNVYETASHPGRPAGGARALVRQAAALGRPVIAIGGIDAARAREVREAGAYGVAAITALWRAPDPAAAALALLAPWTESA